ncbi:MAG: ComEC/Rec2 family competence protein [Oscillospiraceae bacterium]
MRRPLFWTGLVFLAVTAAFWLIPRTAVWWIALISVMFAACYSGASRRRGLLLFCTVALCAFCWSEARFALLRHRCAPFYEATSNGSMMVEKANTYGSLRVYEGYATLLAPDGHTFSADMTLTALISNDVVLAGEIFPFSARVQQLSASPAEAIKGLTMHYMGPPTARCPDLSPLHTQPLRLRLALSSRVAALSSDDGVLSALLTGDSEHMTGEAVRALRGAGLSHIAVVSGMHLALLAGCLNALLPLRWATRTRSLLIVAFCWLFALMTGLGPSVVRSAIMLSLTQIAGLLGQRGDGLTSLAFAGLIIACWDPSAVGTLSFLLSFFATGGLLVLSGPLCLALCEWLHVRHPLPHALLEAFSITASAQLATAPVCIISLGVLAPWGLLANLPVGPLVAILLPLGWASLLVTALFPPLCGLLGSMLQLLTEMMMNIAHLFSNLPFAQIALTERYQMVWCAVFFTAFPLILLRSPRRAVTVHRVLCFLLPLLAAACLSMALSRDTVELLLLDDGVTAVVRSGRATIIGAPNTCRRADAIASALARDGVICLDAIVLTDSAQAVSSVAILATRMGCQVIGAPDTPVVQALCQGSGLSLAPISAVNEIYGVSISFKEGSIRFCFANAQVLKTTENCVIINGSAKPLPAPGRNMLRYRFKVGGTS